MIQVQYDPGGGITLTDLDRGGSAAFTWAQVLLLRRMELDELAWLKISLIGAGCVIAQPPASDASGANCGGANKCAPSMCNRCGSRIES